MNPNPTPIYLATPKWSDTIMVDPRKEPLCKVQRDEKNGGFECILRIPVKEGAVFLAFAVREGGMIGEMYKQGAMRAWGLRRLGPGVWAVDPSIQQGQFHAFVVLCDVPEPPPWSTSESDEPGKLRVVKS